MFFQSLIEAGFRSGAETQVVMAGKQTSKAPGDEHKQSCRFQIFFGGGGTLKNKVRRQSMEFSLHKEA